MTPERVGDAGGRKRPVDPVLVKAIRQIIRLPLAPGTGAPKLLGRVPGSTALCLKPVSVRGQNAGALQRMPRSPSTVRRRGSAGRPAVRNPDSAGLGAMAA